MAFGFHTENRVWGTALNPYDHSRTCGGSSGGDAGLISTRCVPFSVCSDIGGSIRIPAHFTGISGFKPTAWRTSEQGYLAGSPETYNTFT
jgi:Asp-tRNA(Asn)/Glu-tRNA(Gln) amidotransferase A subunit family amidase